MSEGGVGMKLNIIFLIVGIILSVISKWLQFKEPQHTLLGNIIVFPAATFFVLAILWTVPKFKIALAGGQTSSLAMWLAVLSCIAVALFQLTTMLVFGKKIMWGIWLFIPFIGLVTAILKILMSLRVIMK